MKFLAMLALTMFAMLAFTSCGQNNSEGYDDFTWVAVIDSRDLERIDAEKREIFESALLNELQGVIERFAYVEEVEAKLFDDDFGRGIRITVSMEQGRVLTEELRYLIVSMVERSIAGSAIGEIVKVEVLERIMPVRWQRGFGFRANQSDTQVVSAPAGITMNISSYTASGLSFYFENLTEREFTYCSRFALYALINNEWERVEPTIEGHWAFMGFGYRIPPNSATDERTVDWEWLFGELPSGDYRFQKELLYIRQPGDIDRIFKESAFALP